MTLAVVELWRASTFLVHTTSGEGFVLDVPELRDLARDEFAKDGPFSVLRVEGMGGCTFDFSIGEAGDGSGEFFAGAWGDVEDSIEAISQLDGSAEVFRGN